MLIEQGRFAAPCIQRTRSSGSQTKRAAVFWHLLCAAILGVAAAPDAASALPVFSGALNASSTLTANRVTRNAIPSTCGVPKVFPGTIAQPNTQYQVASYTHTGPSRCVTFAISSTTCSTSAFLVVYNGSFDPNNLAANYLGDTGSSSAGATVGVALTTNQTVQLMVAGFGTGLNCAFTVDLLTSNTHDFNPDAFSDIVWRDNAGDVAFWLMRGAQVGPMGGVGGVPVAWSIVGQRDFNGDGLYDLLWRDTSGNVSMWFMNGTTPASTAGVANVPTNWSVVGTGDFNGDGLGDILWRDSSGNLAVWLMSGNAIIGSASLGNVPPSVWVVVGVADFDGDRKSDILWRDVNGNIAIWFMNGTQVISAVIANTVATVWSVVATGDFNDDGKGDILWRDSFGNLAVWLMNGSEMSGFGGLGMIPFNWSVAQTGDFDGDGKSDILWRDTNSGATAISFMDGVRVSQTLSVAVVPLNWTIQGINAD